MSPPYHTGGYAITSEYLELNGTHNHLGLLPENPNVPKWTFRDGFRLTLYAINYSVALRAHVTIREFSACSTGLGEGFGLFGKIFQALCRQHGVELIEGHALPDHVHMCLSVPPKFSLADTIGFLKGKSAIRIHREHLGRKRNFTGFHFWARGYCVSTVGLDEQVIREYIRRQEHEEQRHEQLRLKGF